MNKFMWQQIFKQENLAIEIKISNININRRIQTN